MIKKIVICIISIFILGNIFAINVEGNYCKKFIKNNLLDCKNSIQSKKEVKEWTYMKYVVADHGFKLPILSWLKRHIKSNENLALGKPNLIRKMRVFISKNIILG